MEQAQAPDPLEAALRAAPLNDRQRAGLWDVYETARNADDLAARLKSIEVPDDVKAQLWDLKSQAAPQTPPPSGGASGKWTPNTWSDKLGLNEPTDSMVTGFFRGAGSAAVDMAQGATARVRNAVAKGGDPVLREVLGAVPVEQQQDVATAPDTFAGKVGGVIPDAAAMALPVGRAVKAGVNALPSASRAGANFEKVMGAAKDIVVDVGAAGDRALRVYDLSQKGAYLPKPVANFLQWVTSPKKAPLTYKDSRDFASAMSRLSAAERSSMTPVVKREVAQMAADLNLANANAAKAAGKGVEYKAAMREYANAMRMRDAIDATLKHGKRAALGAAGLGGAAYLLKD